MIESEGLSNSQIIEFLQRFGKHGQAEFDVLMKQIKKLEVAWGSEFAKQVMKDDVERCIFLMHKMFSSALTPEEIIELQYLKGRLDRVSNIYFSIQEREKAILEKLKGGK